MISVFLQMAVWTSGQKLYLPPAPVTKVLCTETYVNRKAIFYHCESDRLLAVGHPFYPVKEIKKVSPNQYRVFQVQLPDPNQFALPDSTAHNPAKERLVWSLVGLQVSRGLPLCPSVTSHPQSDIVADAETPGRNAQGSDYKRKLYGQDVKQSQMLLVGCQPALGEYWGIAQNCKEQPKQGDCPPIELMSRTINDGDMMDIGFGAADFAALNGSKSGVPLDIQEETCLYPDYLKMAEDVSGNSLFFFARKEQSYMRHAYSRAGNNVETPKEEYSIKDAKNVVNGTFSGSLVATDSQIFNRPYWLYTAQGMNNGLLWNNEVYVTVGDNTRGVNLTISVPKEKGQEYSPGNINMYLRHAEEYKLAFILELCGITLSGETLAHLQTMDPDILKRWDIPLQASISLENTYRYKSSGASVCEKQPGPENLKPANNYWTVDLRNRLTLDLDQYPLGRRFLATQGIGCGIKLKRKSLSTSQKHGSAKRRKTGR